MERTYTTPRLDKLGIKPGARVAVIGVSDASFMQELHDRTHDVTVGTEPLAETDVVIFAADSHEELERLRDLAEKITPAGAIWVVSGKGKSATIRDVDVIEASKAAGLIDNKVASFSDTHTALRAVIPVARRGAHAARTIRA